MAESLEVIEYRKHEWGDGPWQQEPDRVEFAHAGLPCLLLRNHGGVWCGYAAVPTGHPLHGTGTDYSPCGHTPEPPIEVHGGLTYASACVDAICHTPKPGEPDDVWWLGFDCAHFGDLSPAYDRGEHRRHMVALGSAFTYKDLAYVRAETERLAEQLAALATT